VTAVALLVQYAAGRLPAVNDAAKATLTFVVSLLVGAFKAFILMLMWNWFVSPVFHTGSITFWQVLGLLWLVQLFVGVKTDDPEKSQRWDNLFLVLNSCVPEHQREHVREAIKERRERIWADIGLHIFGQIFDYSFTLGLAWLVHTFFVAA
jgi:hypothetical protein